MKKLFTRLKLIVRGRIIKYVLIPRAYRWTSRLNILSDLDSIEYILEHHCSVSRFGDGEFDIIGGIGNGFQHPDNLLAARLREVLTSDPKRHNNFMIGIPLPIKDLRNLRNPSVFWPFVTIRHITLFKQTLRSSQLYLNTQMTRFYFEKEDKSACDKQIKSIRSIWQDRKILIVEGEKTRSGVGNDLYDNAKSVRRILCPAVDAFSAYDRILMTIKKYVDTDELILIMLGMTATVLAYDLSNDGKWAIDMGHVDLEYEWFKTEKNERTKIEGKFVQEVEGG